MIKIHKQMWVIKGVERSVEDSSFLLAYMTHREYDKKGIKLVSFDKRMHTGRNWADKLKREYDRETGRYKTLEHIKGEELEFDNTPISGFKIIGSVSRWSTSNKLIRVEDPRGFVIEIPTSNLTTLLKHSVVDHAIVKEQCVWGREGNNHILLPVNSEVYKQACEHTQLHDERVSFTKLTPGNVIKFHADDEYRHIYVGKGKAVWEFNQKESTTTEKHSWSTHYVREADDKVCHTEKVKDKKFAFLFKKVNSDSSHRWEYKYSGKCTVTGHNEDIPQVEIFYIYPPSSVENEVKGYEHDWSWGKRNKYYWTTNVVDIEMKDMR